MNSSSGQSHYDKMTKTDIRPLIVKLSIPTILSLIVTNIYNLVDTAFVGRLGTSASGAVGVVFGYMAIIQAIGYLFGQGAGSMVSRNLGAQNKENANMAASTGILLSFGFGVVIAILSAIFIDPLVIFLGSTDTIMIYARKYISYILVAAPFMCACFTMNNVLRYEGRAMLGTVGMMAGAVLNMIGDPIFMFGLNMGIDGAGLSTAISQVVSFIILNWMFLSGRSETRLGFRYFNRYVSYWWDMITTGFPSLLRQSLNALATVVLNYQAGVYGDAAVAAMSIVSRIVFFVFSFSLGIGQGFQPVSAFNYGARKYDRVKKAYKFTFALAEGLLLIAMLFVLTNAEGLIHIFRDDPEVVAIGTRALKLQMATQLFLPFCMVTEMLMQSTGQKLPASFLSACRSGIFFIPALLILARVRGLAGIQEAQPLAYIISCIPAAILARRFFRQMGQDE